MRASAADQAQEVASQRGAPTDGEISRRAYDLYLARGCEPGRDVDDWLQAERELRSASNLATK
jgi:hypothetical protein